MASIRLSGIPPHLRVAAVLAPVLSAYGAVAAVDLDGGAGGDSCLVSFSDAATAAHCVAAGEVSIGPVKLAVSSHPPPSSRAPPPVPVATVPPPAPLPSPPVPPADQMARRPSSGSRRASHPLRRSEESAGPERPLGERSGDSPHHGHAGPPAGPPPPHPDDHLTALVSLTRERAPPGCAAEGDEARRGPLPVGPFLVYQVLRGVSFPRRVVLLRGKRSEAELNVAAQPVAERGGAAALGDREEPPAAPEATGSTERVVRALVLFASAEEKQNVLNAFPPGDLADAPAELADQRPARFDPGVLVALRGHHEAFRVAARPAREAKVFAFRNSGVSLVVTPQCIARTGPIFPRRALTAGGAAPRPAGPIRIACPVGTMAAMGAGRPGQMPPPGPHDANREPRGEAEGGYPGRALSRPMPIGADGRPPHRGTARRFETASMPPRRGHPDVRERDPLPRASDAPREGRGRGDAEIDGAAGFGRADRPWGGPSSGPRRYCGGDGAPAGRNPGETGGWSGRTGDVRAPRDPRTGSRDAGDVRPRREMDGAYGRRDRSPAKRQREEYPPDGRGYSGRFAEPPAAGPRRVSDSYGGTQRSAPADGARQAPGGPPPVSGRPLPPGWRCIRNPSVPQPYYHFVDDATGAERTQWHKPE